MVILHELSIDPYHKSELYMGIGGAGAIKAYDYIKKKRKDKKDPHRALKMVGAGLAGAASAGLGAYGGLKKFKYVWS